MKYRAVLLIAVFLGICAETPLAQADPPPPLPVNPGWDTPNQGFLGPRLGGDLWRAPSATVNPGSLIPDDSTNSTSLVGSFKLPNVFKGDQKEFKNAKPIEKVEPHLEASIYDQPAQAVAPAGHETHRIAIIAVISVALLAFRKFRRPNAGMRPRKPSFL